MEPVPEKRIGLNEIIMKVIARISLEFMEIHYEPPESPLFPNILNITRIYYSNITDT